jgi:hypothetical protein
VECGIVGVHGFKGSGERLRGIKTEDQGKQNAENR